MQRENGLSVSDLAVELGVDASIVLDSARKLGIRDAMYWSTLTCVPAADVFRIRAALGKVNKDAVRELISESARAISAQMRGLPSGDASATKSNWPSDEHRSSSDLVQAVAELLAIVAEQQRQIEMLRMYVEAASVARLQVQVTELAREDFRDRLANASEILGTIAERGGEFSVGEIEHRGTLSIHHKQVHSEAIRSENGTQSAEAKRIDVGLELKGIAAKLAGVKAGVSVDLSTVHERVDKLDATRVSRNDLKIEGTFETRHKGSVFKFGR